MWSGICFLLGIQEPVRTRTRVQVSSICHLFVGARGHGAEMSTTGSLDYTGNHMIVSSGHSLDIICCAGRLRKSLTPCPLQGAHTLFVLRGMFKVLARTENRKKEQKAAFYGILSVPISQVMK